MGRRSGGIACFTARGVGVSRRSWRRTITAVIATRRATSHHGEIPSVSSTVVKGTRHAVAASLSQPRAPPFIADAVAA